MSDRRISRVITVFQKHAESEYAKWLNDEPASTLWERIRTTTQYHGNKAGSDLFYLHCRKFDPKIGQLNYAVQHGLRGLINLIIESGKNHFQWDLAYLLCYHANIFTFFIYHPGIFKELISKYGNPLHRAESYSLAKLLIMNGTPISDITDSHFPTILHDLSLPSRGGVEVMRAVLESAGSLVDIPNATGQTAMFYASSPEKIVLLSNAGHSVDYEDKNGFRPIHLQISYNCDASIVKALLKAGCEPNAEDKNGRTPLHIVFLGHESHDFRRDELQEKFDIVKALLDYGASSTSKDHDGKIPLDLFTHESRYPEDDWTAIKDCMMEHYDAMVNHCFKRACIAVVDTESVMDSMEEEL